ncbi:MAG: hypothetical protein HQ526_02305, partial [Actinobacteria bacterium]|nr:hypothetical protein [Actinomycetota bacterium]
TQLIRTLASVDDIKPETWATQHGLGRYFESSIKTTEDVDWDDEASRRQFLAGIVDDADKLLANWGGGALGASAMDYYASLHRVAYYGDHTKSIRHMGDLLGLRVVKEV